MISIPTICFIFKVLMETLHNKQNPVSASCRITSSMIYDTKIEKKIKIRQKCLIYNIFAEEIINI